ncbi:hypothetical protein PL83_18750, partial [Vibrio anguillarum]|nr:hypothetical protein [Vibrio anguillarum]
MAQYGNQDQMRKTDEYGNHVQETGTHQGTGMGGMQAGTGGMMGGMGTGGMGGTDGGYGTRTGMGMGMGTGTHHHEGQQQLRRSDSSSSSEDDGEGGRRKKGMKEKIMEKMPGGGHGQQEGEYGAQHGQTTGYGTTQEKKG